jgi:hypothetical protein
VGDSPDEIDIVQLTLTGAEPQLGISVTGSTLTVSAGTIGHLFAGFTISTGIPDGIYNTSFGPRAPWQLLAVPLSVFDNTVSFTRPGLPSPIEKSV